MARPRRKDIEDDLDEGQEEGSRKSKALVVPINQKERREVQEKVKDAVERIEAANEGVEKARINKSTVMKECVDMGLDRAILNKIVKLRKSSEKNLASEAELTKLYAEAVGLQLEFDF